MSDFEVEGPFEQQIRVSESDGYRGKIVAAIASPFDATIFLDTDTFVLRDLSSVFTLLERFDIAAAQAPTRASLDLPDVPASFPELNTGVIAFRRNGPVTRLLEDWLAEYDRLGPQVSANTRVAANIDQAAFRGVVYRSEVRLATLTPEFNLLFTMAGYHNQPVHILHGLSTRDRYEAIGREMNSRAGERRYRAVFAGMRLFNVYGKLEADYVENRRLKTIRSLVLRRM